MTTFKKGTGEINFINTVYLEQHRFELLRFTYTGIPPPQFRTVLHSAQLVESVAEESQIWRADKEQDHHWVLISMAGPGTSTLGYSGKTVCGFSTVQPEVGAPNSRVVQGSTPIAGRFFTS